MEYYVAAGPHAHRRGPFALEQLKTEEVRADTLVWKTGLPEWVRADALPEVRELLKQLPPPLDVGAEPLPQAIPVAQPAVPWNPAIIGWLGLVFSPIWSGIMAAVNAHRLGCRSPWWRPVSLGLGWLAADILLSRITDSYLLSLALYLLAVWLVYALDLRAQRVPYRQASWPAMRTRTWLTPVLAGLPLAVVTTLAFVVSPLSPLEPRDVCQRFLRATTEAEMKKYTTLNLWPVLPELAKPDASGEKWDFELTDEADAPADVGGHLVGLRASGTSNGERMQSVGLFHLVQRDNTWKIEEIYFTAINGQPLENWMAVSRDFPRTEQPQSTNLAAGTAKPPAANQPRPVAGETKGTDWRIYRFYGIVVAHLVHDGGGKAIMGILAAIGLCFARLFGHRPPTTSDKDRTDR